MLVLAMLPSIQQFALRVEQFQQEVAGDLLTTTQALLARVRHVIKTVMVRYGITEAEVADWHTCLFSDPDPGLDAA